MAATRRGKHLGAVKKRYIHTEKRKLCIYIYFPLWYYLFGEEWGLMAKISRFLPETVFNRRHFPAAAGVKIHPGWDKPSI